MVVVVVLVVVVVVAIVVVVVVVVVVAVVVVVVVVVLVVALAPVSSRVTAVKTGVDTVHGLVSEHKPSFLRESVNLLETKSPTEEERSAVLPAKTAMTLYVDVSRRRRDLDLSVVVASVTSSLIKPEPNLPLKLVVNAVCNVPRPTSALKVNCTFVAGGGVVVTAVLAAVLVVPIVVALESALVAALAATVVVLVVVAVAVVVAVVVLVAVVAVVVAGAVVVVAFVVVVTM